MLYSCHKNCESCSEGGDDNKNNCDKCKPDLHFYEDKQIKNCVKDPPFENYYLDKMNDTFYECYERCG